MKKRKLAKFWERLNAPTPEQNKRRGRLMTAVSSFATGLIVLGAVTNPIGIAALSAVAVLTGGTALFDGAQVKENETETDEK